MTPASSVRQGFEAAVETDAGNEDGDEDGKVESQSDYPGLAENREDGDGLAEVACIYSGGAGEVHVSSQDGLAVMSKAHA